MRRREPFEEEVTVSYNIHNRGHHFYLSGKDFWNNATTSVVLDYSRTEIRGLDSGTIQQNTTYSDSLVYHDSSRTITFKKLIIVIPATEGSRPIEKLLNLFRWQGTWANYGHHYEDGSEHGDSSSPPSQVCINFKRQSLPTYFFQYVGYECSSSEDELKVDEIRCAFHGTVNDVNIGQNFNRTFLRVEKINDKRIKVYAHHLATVNELNQGQAITDCHEERYCIPVPTGQGDPWIRFRALLWIELKIGATTVVCHGKDDSPPQADKVLDPHLQRIIYLKMILHRIGTKHMMVLM